MRKRIVIAGTSREGLELLPLLEANPAVELCALIGAKDPQRPGNDIVHLHVQLTADGKARPQADVDQEIMAFCRATMAPYKVPKKVIFHDALPLTAVGKLDKKALRA